MHSVFEFLGDGIGLSPEEFVQWLDGRVGLLVTEIGESPMWAELTAPDADPAFVHAFMKEIYLEIFFYNQHIVETTFAIIGQMPRTLDVRALKAMLRHQAEEFEHGEMGLRDYVAMGGDELEARQRRLSPGAFAAAGMWCMLAKIRDPFAYLGAEYLFESLTPILSERVKPFLVKKGMASSSLEFIDFHSAEDTKHAKLMQELIMQVVEHYPTLPTPGITAPPEFLHQVGERRCLRHSFKLELCVAAPAGPRDRIQRLWDYTNLPVSAINHVVTDSHGWARGNGASRRRSSSQRRQAVGGTGGLGEVLASRVWERWFACGGGPAGGA